MQNLITCAYDLSSHRSDEGGSVVDTDLLRLAASVAATAAKSHPVLGVETSTFCFRALHNFSSVAAAREFSPAGSSQGSSLGLCLTFFTWTRMVPLLFGSGISSTGVRGTQTIRGQAISDLGGKGTLFYNMFRYGRGGITRRDIIVQGKTILPLLFVIRFVDPWFAYRICIYWPRLE